MIYSFTQLCMICIQTYIQFLAAIWAEILDKIVQSVICASNNNNHKQILQSKEFTVWNAYVKSKPPNSEFDLIHMLSELMKYYEYTVQKAYHHYIKMNNNMKNTTTRYKGSLLHVCIDNIDRAIYSSTIVQTILTLTQVCIYVYIYILNA